MVESITLQLLDLEITECKKQDLQKKFHIAVNIMKRCELDNDEHKPIYDIHDVAHITGVPSDTLRKVRNLDDTYVKFQDWLIERQTEFDNSIYNKIRTYLWDHYSQTYQIPTKKRLQSIMKKAEYCTPEALRHFKFFTSINLPGTKVSITVEKPEIVMRRFQYLHTKLMYHEEGRNIVYIGARSLFTQCGKVRVKKSNNYNSRWFLLAASSKSGYISSFLSPVSDEMAVKFWIVDKVIPMLPPESVVVVSDSIWYEKLESPSSNAFRKDMLNWLEEKGIPHDPTCHRAELFSLIETCTRTYRTEAARIKKIMTAKGHIVLQRPKETEFSFYDRFWTQLADILSFRKGKIKNANVSYILPLKAKHIASKLSVSYWSGLEIELLCKEQKTYREDLEMEGVIDKLMTFTKHEHLKIQIPKNLYTYCKAMDKKYIF